MIRLLSVELTRLRWRRAVLLLLAAAVLLPALIWGVTAWNTRPVSDAEQARAERMVQRDTERQGMQRQLRQCVDHPDRFGVVEDDVEAACEQMMLPQVEWYLTRSPLDLDEERRGSGLGVVTVLAVLLLLAGTTFVGHDWNSGSMSNQLLFDPRRARVWAAKAGAVVVVGAVLAGLVLTAYWTGLWMLADSRGIDPVDGVVSGGYEQVLRGTAFAVGAALGGYALTMLLRSTVASLGVLFAVSLVGPLLLALVAFPGFERWMPQNNIAAFVVGDLTYYAEDTGMEEVLSMTHGAVFLLALVLLATVASVLTFRRRDVP